MADSPAGRIETDRDGDVVVVTIANFPSVDNDTQRSRDAGRRKILEQELAQEQGQLDTAKKQLAEQKNTRLGTEKNFARLEERLKPFEDKVKLQKKRHDEETKTLKERAKEVEEKVRKKQKLTTEDLLALQGSYK